MILGPPREQQIAVCASYGTVATVHPQLWQSILTAAMERLAENRVSFPGAISLGPAEIFIIHFKHFVLLAMFLLQSLHIAH